MKVSEYVRVELGLHEGPKLRRRGRLARDDL
jgi:hypothetical protein